MSQYPRWEAGIESANDVTHRKRAEDLGNFEEGWVESCLGRRRLTFACSRRPCDGCARVGVGAKSQNRNNVHPSPYVEEPLNSKVIKSFVPELRSRKCFFVFRDSYVLCIYKWTFYIHFAYPYLAMIHMESNALDKSTNNCFTSRFSAGILVIVSAACE